jgi:hypothetical protein
MVISPEEVCGGCRGSGTKSPTGGGPAEPCAECGGTLLIETMRVGPTWVPLDEFGRMMDPATKEC